MLMEGALVMTRALTPTPPPNVLDVSTHRVAAPCPPPCPPPPPPPPLFSSCTVPPPPPPPPPPLPPFSSHTVQRRSMKKLNWDAIPSQCVVGKVNVWTSQRQQKDIVLDIRSMEELFSHADTRTLKPRTRTSGHKRIEGMTSFAEDPQVSILDSKRSMNLGIFLKQFKRPITEMVDDICKGNWLKFEAGKLKELCKLLPDASEVKRLRSFTGDLSHLPEADKFMVHLVKIPSYEERLNAMVLREEFFPLMEELNNSVAVMTKAANELLVCDNLHSIIRLVLKAGNYMNSGGCSGSTIGFRMMSLLRLADTKANKPGMNLLHFVAKQAEGIDPEMLTFSTQLEHIGMASRFSKEEIKADFETEVKKIAEVKMYASRQPGLLQQMDTFIIRAEAKLADLKSLLQELESVSNAMAEYFCEDPAVFNLEECCTIFHSFCKKFETAVKENREREASELRRKRKESLRTSAKARSARSEPQCELDSSSLESVLHSFLSSAPEGGARGRRCMLPPIEGSPSGLASLDKPSEKEPPVTPDRSPLEKHQPERRAAMEEEEPVPQNQEDVEKMREVTRKVLRYQNSRGNIYGDKPDTPCRQQRPEATLGTPCTPCTPHPRTRDFFFANNGYPDSPWTILSPFSCPRGKTPSGARHPSRLKKSMSNGDDLDDVVWRLTPNVPQSTPTNPKQTSSATACPSGVSSLTDGGDSHPCCSFDLDRLTDLGNTTSGSASLPECPRQRASAQGPIHRSLSLDETTRPSLSDFWIGDMLQNSTDQRPRSCLGICAEVRMEEGVSLEKPVERQGSSSGFISFLRRIGSRSKPVDEHSFSGSDI